MSRLLLSEDRLLEVIKAYSNQPFLFPLVGAVLTGVQPGIVLSDSDTHPKRWYVEHAFGFSQIFGEPSQVFDDQLYTYLFVDRKFKAPKVRLYGADAPRCISEGKCLHAERQRFVLDRVLFERSCTEVVNQTAVTFMELSLENIHLVENEFGVTTRFWRTSADFVQHARAVVALIDGKIAAICYAAAQFEESLEIDVFTLSEFRGRGIGLITVTEFIKRSLDDGLEPLWDCFTNNAGSMALSNSLGFIAKGAPYPFFTIER